MAKTLKQMLELYKPKAADEQKFADKHVVAKTDDVNGNKDDVFKGANVKAIDRKATRKGYNPGEDEKVYESLEDFSAEELEAFMQTEEYEQLDELSKTTLGNYIKKAAQSVGGKSAQATSATHQALDAQKRAKDPKLAFAKSGNDLIAKAQARKQDKLMGQVAKRKEGIAGAVSRLTKEETELEEKMAPGADAGKFIKDFEKSDAPQFEGKSKEKRRQMAIAAYMSQKNEEVEHIEEKLIGKQHKIDKNKNNKIDAHDFKLLRKESTGNIVEKLIGKQHKIDKNKNKKIDAHDFELLRKEETEQINEGEEAHAQFQKYHAETAKLLKNIHAGLSKHYDNVTSKKGYNNGQAHWGHVGDIKNIHRQLQDIHDSVLQTGEYAAPPKPLKTMKEEVEVNDVDVTLLSLYVNLDEENRASMIQMIEEGRKEELLAFTETLGAE